MRANTNNARDHYLSPYTVMVLADLGRKLNAALSSLNRAPVVDEKVLIHPTLPSSNLNRVGIPCRYECNT